MSFKTVRDVTEDLRNEWDRYDAVRRRLFALPPTERAAEYTTQVAILAEKIDLIERLIRRYEGQ